MSGDNFRRIALPVVLVLLPFCLRLWCCVFLAIFRLSRALVLELICRAFSPLTFSTSLT